MTPIEPHPEADPSRTHVRARNGLWPLIPLAGLLAGAGAWLLGELTHETFRPAIRRVDTMAGPMMVPETVSKRRTDTGNAALVYGGLGALLGLALGWAGGRIRGSPAASRRAGLIGAVAGAALPAALALAAVPYHIEYLRGLDPAEANLAVPLLFHAAVWAGVGLAGGLALGLGLGGRDALVKAIVGGCAGALLGTGLYEVLAATAVSDGNSAEPLSESGAVRMIACLAVAGGVALVAAASVGSGRRTASAPDDPGADA